MPRSVVFFVGGAMMALALSGGCKSRSTLIGESVAAALPTEDGGAGHVSAALIPAAIGPVGPPAAVAPVEAPAPVPPAKVHLSVRAIPKATVSWGKKLLGVTPVTIDRPRDSGPVDLVLHAKGYLPLHTRVYSFRNDAITATLTKVEDSGKLLGAKKAPPPAPDAAAPAAATTTTTTTVGAPVAPVAPPAPTTAATPEPAH